MTDTTTRPDLYWDPYDPEIFRDPYPTYRRLREEAPLYYNAEHDFFALSRADDLEHAYTDKTRLINGRSDIIEYIKSGVEFPPGTVIFEDPPLHTRHRALLSRMFTPIVARKQNDRSSLNVVSPFGWVIGSNQTSSNWARIRSSTVRWIRRHAPPVASTGTSSSR
ncbi:MAG TPA: hypothetical protein VIY72_03250, partial [Acidimicrobiales bacterium]